MNAPSEPDRSLGAIIDTAPWVVVDGMGKPGRRVWSLHTSVYAAATMAHQLKKTSHLAFSVTVLPRCDLEPKLLAELDQVVTALKNEPELLALSEQELAAVDTFTIFEAREYGVPAKQFEPLHIDERAMTLRLAEQMFAHQHARYPVHALGYLASVCFRQAEEFVKIAAKYAKTGTTL